MKYYKTKENMFEGLLDLLCRASQEKAYILSYLDLLRDADEHNLMVIPEEILEEKDNIELAFLAWGIEMSRSSLTGNMEGTLSDNIKSIVTDLKSKIEAYMLNKTPIVEDAILAEEFYSYLPIILKNIEQIENARMKFDNFIKGGPRKKTPFNNTEEEKKFNDKMNGAKSNLMDDLED